MRKLYHIIGFFGLFHIKKYPRLDRGYVLRYQSNYIKLRRLPEPDPVGPGRGLLSGLGGAGGFGVWQRAV